MGKPFDHRPAGWIRQSRKCCTETIHNHMVVDFPWMSSANFAIPAPLTHSPDDESAQPQIAKEREPPPVAAPASGPEECGLPLEPVLDVPPACQASVLCS